jgi:hypothetical protein
LRGAAMSFCISGLTSVGTGRDLAGTRKGGSLLDCAPATVEAKAVQRRVRMFVRITGIPLDSRNYLNSISPAGDVLVTIRRRQELRADPVAH